MKESVTVSLVKLGFGVNFIKAYCVPLITPVLSSFSIIKSKRVLNTSYNLSTLIPARLGLPVIVFFLSCLDLYLPSIRVCLLVYLSSIEFKSAITFFLVSLLILARPRSIINWAMLGLILSCSEVKLLPDCIGKKVRNIDKNILTEIMAAPFNELNSNIVT